MQTTSINPALTPERQRQNREELFNDIQAGIRNLNEWLDTRSDFYSRIMEEDISWRQALRAGVVLPLLVMLVVGCVTVAPVVAMSCLAAAAWVTHRINAADKATAKKGGRSCRCR